MNPRFFQQLQQAERFEPRHFASEQWPEPDLSLAEDDRRQAPEFPSAVFGTWATWIERSAEVKCAPPDYVAASLLATTGALVGNNRWAAPRDGWAEPPVLWAALVGDPSAGKSPALDSVLDPLRQIERRLAAAFDGDYAAWQERAEIAAIAKTAWQEKVRAALKSGDDVPAKPVDVDAGPAPSRPRLHVSDATTEKLGAILAEQWRGLLLIRDELAGWLLSLDRYSGGGDRPFWIEAYGGRSYRVERQKSAVPTSVDRLTIGVCGGIQLDKVSSLLLTGDDDGLLSRFIVVWPEPVPLQRLRLAADEHTLMRAFEKLLTLRPAKNNDGGNRPLLVPFDIVAQDLLHSGVPVQRP